MVVESYIHQLAIEDRGLGKQTLIVVRRVLADWNASLADFKLVASLARSNAPIAAFNEEKAGSFPFSD